MKVYVNARFLTQKVTGVQRYAIELSKALEALDTPLRFHFLAPKNILHHDLAETLKVRTCGRLTGHAWEQLELPFYSKDGLLLNLCNTAPLVKHEQIVTIHDATFFAMPETFSAAFRTWYQFLLPQLGRRSLAITTVSNFSKKEMVRYGVAREEKIHLVYPSGEQVLAHTTDTDILEKHGLNTKPFVFAVSSQSPNKNFALLAKALELIPNPSFDVVVAGGRHASFAHTTTFEKIKYLGYVSDSELKALYEHAACFVYPSLYEGFGLPPLEAMHCGCPVIASNAASLPEVCGEAALYIDPKDPHDLASKLEQLVRDTSLQSELRTKGLTRNKVFSWQRSAETMLALIERVVR